MPLKNHRIAEVNVLGSSTKKWIVQAVDCPLLAAHHIKHVEVFDTTSPFRIVRSDPDGSFLLACFAGQGRILLDGRWQQCRSGMVSVVPPHVLNAFHAIPKFRWGICCVRYREPRGQRPIVTANSPVISRVNPEPLRLAILGLYHEAHQAAHAAAIRHWVELIHGYAIRIAQPWHIDPRLWRLWEEVGAKLSEEWTRERLSKISHMSNEHLRRLCRQQLGRSPMQQVTYLRIQRAAELLESTYDKVETISVSVGYNNSYVFSNTFKKWTGRRPSEYRVRAA